MARQRRSPSFPTVRCTAGVWSVEIIEAISRHMNPDSTAAETLSLDLIRCSTPATSFRCTDRGSNRVLGRSRSARRRLDRTSTHAHPELGVEESVPASHKSCPPPLQDTVFSRRFFSSSVSRSLMSRTEWNTQIPSTKRLPSLAAQNTVLSASLRYPLPQWYRYVE